MSNKKFVQINNRVFSLFVLMAHQYGMASLLSCASYLGRFLIHSTDHRKTVLFDRAGVGSASE